ncbi:RNB domain-containing ribonuclease [Candidatus Protochlamydia phocaeensis]|uniref:RNB domain-containing ribonuclease n=1 Tax=Candidatus Protochlamydia phocaeensis TaxID=1414722 RepID=UPI0008390FF8|nr:RNB domain-containing ribonuclease [Candidatus Protochlamydia phocaeensis]
MTTGFALPSTNLTELARQALLERHFFPDFSIEAKKELDRITGPAHPQSSSIKDLRNKLWFSLDNDDSKDLDQLTYAESLDQGKYKVFIAIADVDSLVKKDSALDRHAQNNTVTIYTPTKNFTMLPEKLSTDLTSLNPDEDRLAIVVEVLVNPDGSPGDYQIYSAFVHNYAKLAYNSVSDWLDGKAPIPERIAHAPKIEEQIRLQDNIAHLLKKYRHAQGALTLETIESYAIIKNGQVVDVKILEKNRGRNLIEDFMIAANGAVARFLSQHNLPSFKRVVRIPKRWDRIVEIAREKGGSLPDQPDAKALDLFLIKQRLTDPLHFPDLSLTVIKLLGKGEYIIEYPDQPPVGHFSLAVKHYTHSTAPNRRYPDIISQRLIKSILENSRTAYQPKELERLAKLCTEREDDADKIERRMKKSAVILLLASKLNETFDALVTGSAAKGTWVRIFHPIVEGKLIQGFENVDVGDTIRVKLVHLDIEKGFIDFIKV